MTWSCRRNGKDKNTKNSADKHGRLRIRRRKRAKELLWHLDPFWKHEALK